MTSEEEVRAKAVKLILDGEPEKALQLLSDYYGVRTPKLRVGLPKRYTGVLGCYVASEQTIYVKSSDQYHDPFIILHEYYHHLRTFMGKHRGTEKNANKYALESIRYYLLIYGKNNIGKESIT